MRVRIRPSCGSSSRATVAAAGFVLARQVVEVTWRLVWSAADSANARELLRWEAVEFERIERRVGGVVSRWKRA
jgi:hypothetical protein